MPSLRSKTRTKLKSKKCIRGGGLFGYSAKEKEAKLRQELSTLRDDKLTELCELITFDFMFNIEKNKEKIIPITYDFIEKYKLFSKELQDSYYEILNKIKALSK